MDFHLKALTEPYVNLSVRKALINHKSASTECPACEYILQLSIGLAFVVDLVVHNIFEGNKLHPIPYRIVAFSIEAWHRNVSYELQDASSPLCGYLAAGCSSILALADIIP